MGKNQSASNLTNIIKQDANGNITFVSGSTTLMSVSSSGAIATTGNVAGTASYATNAELLDGLNSTVFATTGSNTFKGPQYISSSFVPTNFTDTASLYTDGGLRVTKNAYLSSSLYIAGDLTVFGTQSVNYITSSQLNIADNIITVNTSTPAVRFGGIAVQDSGSLATGLTGSLLWDSQNNHWIYTNPSGSSYSGGMLISGPRNTGSMGDEQGTTFNAIMKGMGGDHITSSGIFESGSNVGIGNSNPSYSLDVTGTGRFKASGNAYTNGSIVLTNSNGATSTYMTNTGGIFYLSNNGSTDHFQISSTGVVDVAINVNNSTSGLNLVNNQGSGYGNSLNYYTSTTKFGSIQVESSVANTSEMAFKTMVGSTLATKLFISSAGNVLIGTTTDNGNKLQVNGNINNAGNIGCYTNNGYTTRSQYGKAIPANGSVTFTFTAGGGNILGFNIIIGGYGGALTGWLGGTICGGGYMGYNSTIYNVVNNVAVSGALTVSISKSSNSFAVIITNSAAAAGSVYLTLDTTGDGLTIS
jgi:hypothetical protein